jgi:nucleoside-diphosphate-sugar epimerase
MKILITGSNGYLGQAIYKYLYKYHTLVLINRTICDLTDTSCVESIFNEHGFFDCVIHSAAVGGSRLKTDTVKVISDNLTIFYNLYRYKHKFNKLISFGSGAELSATHSPYGFSKKIISNIILDTNNFFNLRIFGVFDEDEIETRFIKSNLDRYLNKKNLIIHSNKQMDFIYMLDLIQIINLFITNNNMPKELDCVYKDKYWLSDIANFINQLNDTKVDIIINEKKHDSPYIGNYYDLGIQQIGLFDGIKLTFKKIQERFYEKSMVCTKSI